MSCGKGFGIVKTVEKTWPDIVSKLSKHIETNDKESVGFFVGGGFNGVKRQDEFLECRSLLTLDIDKYQGDISALEFDLDLSGWGAFVAYSTHRHTSDMPRVRVVMPLSREVSGDEYRALSQAFCREFGSLFVFDECSYKPNQFMFLPSCPVGAVGWTIQGQGEPVDVEKYLSLGGGGGVVASDEFSVLEDDDEEDFTRDLPLNMSDDEVKGLLLAYGASGLEYDDWLKVGQALHHQYQGGDVGYDLWVSWSALSDKHNERVMRKKYDSFGTWKGARVTMATVAWRVKEQGGVVVSVFDGLREEAKRIVSMSEYCEFKKRIVAMNDSVLHSDMRAVIANDLALGVGKELGITKAEIKKAISEKAVNKKTQSDNVAALPDWLEDWIYVEKLCEFANTRLNYSIKREAFNAKYNRHNDVKHAEMIASDYALNVCELLTVVDKMYWPSAAITFEYDNKLMLNSYVDSGYKPVAIDDGNKRVIDLFLTHISNVLVCEREQRILIDWLAYVVQNAGKRINWAILLQGAQGTGKSYFAKLLEWVLGTNAKSLDHSALGERFTGWAHGSVVNIVEEIRIKGDDKWRIMDRLKPFITNSMIQIEEKGRDHRTVPNFTNYLLLTNYKDALPITNDDRRFCVMYGRIQNEQELFDYFGGRDAASDYFETLFSESEKHAGALKTYLLNHKISEDFKPQGRAPDTESRQQMIQATISPEQCSVEDLINKHDCAVINGLILDITWLAKQCEIDGEMLPPTRTLAHILNDMGYQQIEGRRLKIQKTGNYHYIWHKNTRNNSSEDVKNIIRDFYKNNLDEVPF